MSRHRVAVAILFSAFCFPARADVWSAVNSADYSRPVARGSIFTLFGYSIGPSQLAKASSYPLPLQLGGTSVTITAGGVTLDCPMVYSSESQVAAMMPSRTIESEALLTVTYAGRSSSVTVQVVPASFGIYSVNSRGTGAGVITGANYAPNSFRSPSRPGEPMIIWGTGLGPISADDGAGPAPGTEFNGVEVFVGSAAARILYAGRSGCCAGLDQIVVETPAQAEGCLVPISVRVAGRVSNFVSAAVASAGECGGESGVPGPLLARAMDGDTVRVGHIGIGPIPVLQGGGYAFSLGIAERISRALGKTVSETDVRKAMRAYTRGDRKAATNALAGYKAAYDAAGTRARQVIKSALDFNQLGAAAAFGSLSGVGSPLSDLAALFPAVGTCTVFKTTLRLDASGARSTPLDAGASLTIAGPLGTRTMTTIGNAEYQVSLGSGTGLILPAGFYQVTGTGGKDIPAFTAGLNVADPLIWTNKSAADRIDRSSPLTVTWSGGSEARYVVIGATSHIAGERTTVFSCVEAASKGQFTIPQFVLSAIAATLGSEAYMFVAPHPIDNAITIPGLDFAYISNAGSDYRTVVFR